MDFGTGGVSALHELAQLPPTPDGASEAWLHAERRIRDDFTVYSYAHDSRDLEKVLGFFTADCVVVGPRGRTVHGAGELRAKYQQTFAAAGGTRHVWANVLVRIVDPAREAYLGAYHHTLLLGPERNVCATGTDIRHLRKVGDDWKIARRWLTIDVESELGPAELQLTAPALDNTA